MPTTIQSVADRLKHLANELDTVRESTLDDIQSARRQLERLEFRHGAVYVELSDAKLLPADWPRFKRGLASIEAERRRLGRRVTGWDDTVDVLHIGPRPLAAVDGPAVRARLYANVIANHAAKTWPGEFNDDPPTGNRPLLIDHREDDATIRWRLRCRAQFLADADRALAAFTATPPDPKPIDPSARRVLKEFDAAKARIRRVTFSDLKQRSAQKAKKVAGMSDHTVKAWITRLRDLGYLDTKTGRGGGSYITTKGATLLDTHN